MMDKYVLSVFADKQVFVQHTSFHARAQWTMDRRHFLSKRCQKIEGDFKNVFLTRLLQN